jgi:type II secretory pathway pseudopilin PulG
MLEVLVALVLVTSVGVAILLWVENGLHAVNRLREEYRRMQAVQLCQDWVRAQPLGSADQGEATLGELKLRWHRTLVAASPQVGYPDGRGSFDVMLYRYRYAVFQRGDAQQPWFEDEAVVTHTRFVRAFRPPL